MTEKWFGVQATVNHRERVKAHEDILDDMAA